MTQAYNLSQLANNLNSSGQLDATDGLVNAVQVANGGTGASTALAARTNLGLGSIATQASSNVSITGGSITGITDLAVADGGTGASSFTNGKILRGNGTSALSVASAADIVAAIGTTAVTNATNVSTLTTSQVLTANAGAAYKAIGTYIFATFLNYDNELTPGSTISGSNLNAAGVQGLGGWYSNAGGFAYEEGNHTGLTGYTAETLPGTWRSMGCSLKYSNGRPSTLWLRIS